MVPDAETLGDAANEAAQQTEQNADDETPPNREGH
jgi:hypothetical protein